MTYFPGEWKMVCDRCGRTFLRSQMKEEWTGLWVCTRGCYQTRHPQDFVEAVPDDPSVPVSRPAIIQSVGEITLYADVTIWTTRVFLNPVIGVEYKHPIGVRMNNGATHWTYIDTETINIYTGQPLLFEDGGIFYDPNYVVIEMEGDDEGYLDITLNTPVSYLCSSGNMVYLPAINNESWT